MNNKNLITKNQIGFKEKSRTADHIFTLKTIIEQYKQKSKKFLLLCFNISFEIKSVDAVLPLRIDLIASLSH
jgi:hypothetical protein